MQIMVLLQRVNGLMQAQAVMEKTFFFFLDEQLKLFVSISVFIDYPGLY